MRSFMLLLMVVSQVAQATTVSAMATTADAQPTAKDGRVTSQTAAALARLIAPIDVVVPIEIQEARKSFLSLPTIDKDAQELEREHPGVHAAIWSAVEPEMKRQAQADHPGFWTQLERLYADRLTQAEAEGMEAFYRSPTGQRLLRNMYGGFDSSNAFKEMVKSGSDEIDAASLRAAGNAARAKAVERIGPADRPALMALAATIDLTKLRGIGEETQKLTLEWVNRNDPEGEAVLLKIVEEATKRHIGNRPSK